LFLVCSDEAKKCCSEFETSRPRDPCYDFVMLYIYIKSLSKINFLRLEDVITLLYPSISFFKLIVSIADLQCLFCLVLRRFLRVKSRKLARYFRVGFEAFDGSDSRPLSFPVPP